MRSEQERSVEMKPKPGLIREDTPAIFRLASKLSWRPRLRGTLQKALDATLQSEAEGRASLRPEYGTDNQKNSVNFFSVPNDERIESIARSFVGRPEDTAPYKYAEMKDGLRIEARRLAPRPFLVSLVQEVYDLDGRSDYVFLNNSFDTEAEAIFRAGRYAQECISLILDCHRDWQLVENGKPAMRQMWRLPSEGSPKLRHLSCTGFRGPPSHSAYLYFSVTGQHSPDSFLQELIGMVAERVELWSYFVDVSEATRKGRARPKCILE